jgi:sister-chromatid-cohesion protein PDS5
MHGSNSICLFFQSIFELFSQQIPGIGSIENNPYYSFYVQLFTSLAMVRSITLVADLENSEELMTDFFVSVLENLKPDHPPTLLQHAVDLLCTLIDESNTVPHEVAELLLSKFKFGDSSVCRKVTIEIARHTSDRLQKHVCQYFTDIILSSAKQSQQDKGFNEMELSEAHELMVQIFKEAPGLLLNVVPQLEEEMVTDNVTFRCIAITTIGKMLLVPNQQFFKLYPSAWRSWLNRRNDKVTKVRGLWLGYIPSILNVHSVHIYQDLNDCLEQKLLDVDDKIRYQACQVISELDFDVFRRFMKSNVITTLGSRVKDKKLNVRLQAMKTLGTLWNELMTSAMPLKVANVGSSNDSDESQSISFGSQNGTQTDSALSPSYQLDLEPEHIKSYSDENELLSLMSSFSWIPRDLLGSAYLNDNQLSAVLENILIEVIVHPKEVKMEDLITCAERLLWFLSCIIDEEKSKRAIYSVFQRQEVTMRELKMLFELSDKLNKESLTLSARSTVQEQINTLIAAMSERLPDPGRGQECLSRFLKQIEPDWSNSFLSLLNWGGEDFKTIRKIGRETLHKMEANIPGSMNTLGVIARRISPFLVCQEMIPFFLEAAVKEESGWGLRLQMAAKWILETASSLFPFIFRPHVKQIHDLITIIPDLSLRLLAQTNPTIRDEKVKGELVELAKTSDHGALACITLAHADCIDQCVDLLDFASQTLQSHARTPKQSLVALRILTKLVKLQSELCSESFSEICNICLQELSNEYTSEDASIWLPYPALPLETKVQLQCLKFLTVGAVVYSSSHSSNAHSAEASRTALKCIENILKSKGSMELELPAFAKSALRLGAGRCLIRIARLSKLDTLISDDLYLLFANLVEDSIFEVRDGILNKVKADVFRAQLSSRYIPIVCLALNNPEESIRISAASFLKHLCQMGPNSRNRVVETSFPRLLHILSRAADNSIEQLSLSSSYIDFYLDAILRADTVSYLFHVAGTIKEYRDKNSPLKEDPQLAESQCLYILAELAMKSIRTKCKFHSWPISTYPNRVDLSNDIFEALPLAEARSNVEKNYLLLFETNAVPKKRPNGPISGRTSARGKRLKKSKFAESSSEDGSDEE